MVVVVVVVYFLPTCSIYQGVWFFANGWLMIQFNRAWRINSVHAMSVGRLVG